MRKIRQFVNAAFLAALFVAAAAGLVLAEPRLALVVGNSNYTNTSALPNPVNDANLIAGALRNAGFEVEVALDVTQRDLKRAVRDFSQRLEAAGPDGVGLFYYAGHGLQVDGTNYIVPVDARIDNEGDVAIETVSLNNVLATLEYARNRLTFVVLDACRDNPYKRGFRSVQRGLALVDAPRGSLVAYATSPGDVAADGTASNSPYTQALAEVMNEPDLPVEQVFKKVRIRVNEMTGGKQLPWESSSLTGDFYFNGGSGGQSNAADSVVPPPPPVTPPPPPNETPNTATTSPQDAELAYLDAIASNSADDYRQFLADYPNSPRGDQVRRILQAQVENELWKAVADENTVASYQRYVAAFPKGVYAEEAGKRMALLLTPSTKPDRPSGQPTGPDAEPDLSQPQTQPQPQPQTRGECGHPHGNWRVIGIENWDTLFVRSGPGKNYAHIGDIPHDGSGVAVFNCRSVSGYREPWCEIKYKCVEGWAYRRYLTEGAPVGAVGASYGGSGYAVTNVANWDVLNVRAGPGTKYDVVGEIPPDGTGVEVRSCRAMSGYKDKWCIVQYGSVQGWASACCLVDSAGRKPD